ncbi:MAG: glycosyltransferase family 4 protein [Patescibacteria group bacterium]
MKIAFIHQDKRLKTGAGYINELISDKLKEYGVEMRHFFPKVQLVDAPHHMKGLNNILFFFSLLEYRNKVLACDIIQGTTYTPIAFLSFKTPIVSHFGSTTYGFMRSTPLIDQIGSNLKPIWYELKKADIIYELDLKTQRPLQDIVDIETLVAKRATAIIATSEIVKRDLEENGVDKEKIHIVHNAIEDFWFDNISETVASPELVYLGRLGQDVFTLKLKGLDRLIFAYRAFKDIPKLSIIMTANKKLAPWLKTDTNNHTIYTNLYKLDIKEKLHSRRGSILIAPSRYEGFCLSMVEGMSQGLIPVVFPVGVAPEIIKNGENGYLVNSEEEMVEKIGFILNDNKLREQLSQGAIDTSLQFQSKNMTDKLIKIYSDIIAKKPNKLSKKVPVKVVVEEIDEK